ncbi:response regulator [Opitutus sp. ER46]|uniref:response regulator n=1 Tax=Opitutus sp. ER46 TaxID=2161864 RepID=UPI000D32274B|nr:response regulator [Opitutus sp. ER46]PTX90860.1 response regulator [Opitutus sp. ER46]
MARILIIDDDDLLRDVLARTLAISGHIVDQADNGQAGLDRFRAAPADVVITDIVMPVQEGVETILQLRREQPKVPIIAMSGGVANSKLYLNIAGRIGADYVLSKPFSPQELLEAVNRVVGRSPPQQ